MVEVINELEKRFTRECEVDKRNAAEIAYAVAVVSRKAGDFQKAKRYAEVAISMFEELNITSLEDAVARNNVIEGVVIPELIHENVVRDRLKDVLGA